jgi:hypothetical protein
MDAPDFGADVAKPILQAEGITGPSDQNLLQELAAEQAALRRVATLVAGGAEPAEVFTAVADELGHLIGAEASFVSRVDRVSEGGDELDGFLTVVGSYGRVSDRVPVGFRLRLLPDMVQAVVCGRVSPHRSWSGGVAGASRWRQPRSRIFRRAPSPEWRTSWN